MGAGLHAPSMAKEVETQGMLVPSLGWEGPLEEGMAIHFTVPMVRGVWQATVYGVAESQT